MLSVLSRPLQFLMVLSVKLSKVEQVDSYLRAGSSQYSSATMFVGSMAWGRGTSGRKLLAHHDQGREHQGQAGGTEDKRLCAFVDPVTYTSLALTNWTMPSCNLLLGEALFSATSAGYWASECLSLLVLCLSTRLAVCQGVSSCLIFSPPFDTHRYHSWSESGSLKVQVLHSYF